MVVIKVETNIGWIRETADIPLAGHLFLIAFMFVPPALLSFTAQSSIPALSNDIGFTKAMLLLLPLWNLIMWFSKVKLYLFFIPAWIFLGIIAVIKTALLLFGI